MSRDRDRILEQALKHELWATTSPGVDPARRSFSEGGCLDAETLAAWSESALDEAQAAMAEAHVSSCARCQSLVGTFARGTPSTVRTVRTTRTWFYWAPLAAGAAAVTLWMVVPGQQEFATAPPEAKLEEAAPSSPREAAPEMPPPQAQALDAPQQKPEARDALAARSRADRQQFRDEKEQKENAAKAQDSAAAASAPLDAAREAAAPAAAPAAPSVAGLERSARLAFAPVVIISSDPLRRWRVSSPGIERSEDGGATWTLARPSDGEAIVAGSSPSPAVCWLAGQAGVVLITIDGTNFTRADVPDRDDLVSVTATDARNATVTTAGGRTFRTDNGGRSWRPN